MARSRGKRGAKPGSTVAVEEATPKRRTFGDESSDDEVEEADEIEERDEEEAELERMVLGDEAGFMDGIERDEDDDEMDLADEDEAALEKELGLQDETDGVENVDDADVCQQLADKDLRLMRDSCSFLTMDPQDQSQML